MFFPYFTWLLFLAFFTQYVISFSFIFNSFKYLNSNNLTFNEVATITSHGILKLTNDTPQMIGHAFYPNPIRFKTSTNKTPLSFSTSFVFATMPKKGNHGGHGLAFTISPAKELVGAQPNHYLGLLNVTSNRNSSNHLFAIEFDTVLDLEFSDINDNHVGININSIISVNSTAAGFFVEGDSTKHNLSMKTGKKIQAWIDYDALRSHVNVTLSMSSEKPRTPILTVPVDLSSVFKEFMYIGFSAATGELASSHYIFGWSFNMSGKAQSLDLSNLPSIPGVKKNHRGLVIGVSFALMLALLAIVAIVSVIKKLKNLDKIEEWELDVGPHRYSYEELNKATKGFKNEELLGVGGFGSVYKGILPKSKTLIAVKCVSNKSQQGMRAFVSEISTIGRLRHRNLVQLLGWCRKKVDLLLVYDFMANGSLDKYIYTNPRIILTWEQRFKIVKDVAHGLLYLHEEWEQTVIHRDIKAGNVLLDSELNGRLGDFGLAKLCDHESNSSTTRVVGTLGYLAPELTRTGKATTNSDMFAFGALLLEVVCGRRPTEPMASPEELILVDWVWDKWTKESVFEVVDSRLEGKFNEVEVLVVIKLGLMCSSNAPLARPTMRQVVRYLEGEVSLPEKLAPPYEGGWNGGHRWEFEDYVHSYPSTSVLDNCSNLSGVEEEFVNVEAGLTSPLSISSKEESKLIC